jgi:TATA-box binding protein (TBP) (component of TFIID and TFIIIB)
MFDIESEWNSFLEGDSADLFGDSFMPSLNEIEPDKLFIEGRRNINDNPLVPPEPLPLYISTKSIITYFNTPIDINRVFWNLKVSPYNTPEECVIKKEIKLTSQSMEEVEEIDRKIAEIPYVKVKVITHLNNPDGRIKFKDVRKIIVGLSKKDITSCRMKEKGAFYNCLVLIMRIRMEGEKNFREIHVKVFNTGKIEIPGKQNEVVLQYILDKLIGYIQPLVDDTLTFQDSTPETVLINSNFNCQFYINREKMFSILRSKYRVQCWYDPCCYPGIRCKYNDEENNLKNVSFMIFRTGSVLIVGKCNEDGIYTIYDFVKNILKTEYTNIYQPLTEIEASSIIIKKKSIRKKKIYVLDSADENI